MHKHTDHTAIGPKATSPDDTTLTQTSHVAQQPSTTSQTAQKNIETADSIPVPQAASKEIPQQNKVIFDKPQIMAMSNIAKIISTYDLGAEETKESQIDNDV